MTPIRTSYWAMSRACFSPTSTSNLTNVTKCSHTTSMSNGVNPALALLTHRIRSSNTWTHLCLAQEGYWLLPNRKLSSSLTPTDPKKIWRMGRKKPQIGVAKWEAQTSKESATTKTKGRRHWVQRRPPVKDATHTRTFSTMQHETRIHNRPMGS